MVLCNILQVANLNVHDNDCYWTELLLPLYYSYLAIASYAVIVFILYVAINELILLVAVL